ncbi:PilW family protein [Brevibacillus dissolubilis]|uniref:PilW family protein n=1 Tax=Brevibacillus dissolubilis TaxID=1844116 RepID=UPI0011167D51|nr:prepilin-type N-terminal cleavage/methylation domain-containing protein [Brevibacillus dissolubilis]
MRNRIRETVLRLQNKIPRIATRLPAIIRLYEKNRTLLHNQRGYTMVELLAACVIFLAVLLPLSSVYVNGLDQYAKTSMQTTLRNETDFMIGEMMRHIQEASYVELEQEQNPVEREKLVRLFQQAGLIGSSADESESGTTSADPTGSSDSSAPSPLDPSRYSTRLWLYDKSLTFSAGRTTSQVTRTSYTFSCDPCEKGLGQPPRQDGYILHGLFEVQSPRRAVLYLLVAHKDDDSVHQLDRMGHPTEFTDLYELAAEADRLYQSGERLEHIRLIRTEINIPPHGQQG